MKKQLTYKEIEAKFNKRFVAPKPFEDTIYSVKPEVIKSFLKATIERVMDDMIGEEEKVAQDILTLIKE